MIAAGAVLAWGVVLGALVLGIVGCAVLVQVRTEVARAVRRSLAQGPRS